jgi:hypothetical protein
MPTTTTRSTSSGFAGNTTFPCSTEHAHARASDESHSIGRRGPTGEWNDIPAAERFELLATIEEMRQWRYGDQIDRPPRLQPMKQAALALYEFRVRSGGNEQGSPTSHSDMQ